MRSENGCPLISALSAATHSNVDERVIAELATAELATMRAESCHWWRMRVRILLFATRQCIPKFNSALESLPIANSIINCIRIVAKQAGDSKCVPCHGWYHSVPHSWDSVIALF
jgi:hypothetical protein